MARLKIGDLVMPIQNADPDRLFTVGVLIRIAGAVLAYDIQYFDGVVDPFEEEDLILATEIAQLLYG